MKWSLLHVTSSKEEWSDISDQLYLTKIKPFVPFEIESIKSKKSERNDSDYKIKAESESILAKLESNDFVVLLDESGQTFNSHQFAEKIRKIQEQGLRRGVFIIGGAFGVSDEVKKRANLKIGLAPFVMNHLVARLVLLEQFYRAQTILKGIPYHNGTP